MVTLGLGHGDRVAIWLPRGRSRSVAQAAFARLGATPVDIDLHARAPEISETLRGTHSRALVLTDHVGPLDCFEVLHEVLPTLIDAIPGEITFHAFPALRWVIVDTDDEYPGCVRLRDVYGDDHD